MGPGVSGQTPFLHTALEGCYPCTLWDVFLLVFFFFQGLQWLQPASLVSISTSQTKRIVSFQKLDIKIQKCVFQIAHSVEN